MEVTNVSKSVVVGSLIFHLEPSVNSPPQDPLDRVYLYAQGAMQIITENEPPGALSLSEASRKNLVNLQRLLRINPKLTPSSV